MSENGVGNRPLTGKIVLVAGATRGAGRAIAVEFGRAGATVYATGRSTRSKRSEIDRAETIEETAELVDAAGGKGIAVPTDHLDVAQVRELVARIDKEAGRLDVLVNDIWGGEHLTEWGKPLWELDLDKGLRMLRLAIDTHIITSHEALPLLIRNPGGLVIEITDGDEEFNREYRQQFFYDLAKITPQRMALALAKELEPHGGTAVSVTPGFLRSEQMLAHFGVTEDNWRDAIVQSVHFGMSETPYFVARCITALAADPDRARWAGRGVASWELAPVYGIRDLDGTQPHFADYYRATEAGADVNDYSPYRR
ncbi:SDR family oxidoreductase [Phytomonospora sp. NPDC050363]|uniref:SDR family oxidoreductase n=1 Tax=Phytomonospora sp. NPDC050363 TaxID=3155642 RepID=UPI0033CC1AC1